MNGFCDVLLRGSEDDDAGRAQVAQLLRAAGTAVADDADRKMQVSVPGLYLGLATAPGAAVVSPRAMVSDRNGMHCFGNLTWWNGPDLADPSDGGSAVDFVGDWHRRKGDPRKISADGICATYDNEMRQMNHCHDHVGAQTVFCAKTELGLVFATRMQFLCSAGMGHLGVDMMSVAAWMVMRHPGHERSFFQGVRELAPAHRLTCAPTGVRPQVRYWSMQDALNPGFTPDAGWVDHVRERLRVS